VGWQQSYQCCSHLGPNSSQPEHLQHQDCIQIKFALKEGFHFGQGGNLSMQDISVYGKKRHQEKN